MRAWRILVVLVVTGGLAVSGAPRAVPQPSPPREGQLYEATGAGATYEEALRAAHRRVVEEAVGALVTSTTLVQNFQVRMDQIYSRSSGYVRQARELRRWQEGGLWNVTIQAQVSVAAVEADMRTLGLLLGNPRIHVSCARGIAEDLCSQAGRALADALAQRGLTVTGSFEGPAADAGEGEILLELTLVQVQTPSPIGRLYRAEVSIQTTAREGSTGEVIAHRRVAYGSNDLLGQDQAREKALLNASRALARYVAEELVKELQNFFLNGQKYVVRVRGLRPGAAGMKQLQALKGAIQNSPGFVRQDELQVKLDGTERENQVALRVLSRGLPSDLRDAIAEGVARAPEAAGLELASVQGHRLAFAFPLPGAGETTVAGPAPGASPGSPAAAARPPASRPEPPKGDRWAVVIGIGGYEDSRVGKLRYTVADAEAVYRYLTTEGGYAPDRVVLLTDKTERKPTLRNLRWALGEFLARRAVKQDTVFIYYAGHGAPEIDQQGIESDGVSKYLIPIDADPDALYSTAFPMDEIRTIFGRIEAERVIVFLDACYSGASGGRTFARAGMRASNLNDQFLERLTRSKGRVIVTAAAANEVSLELPELGHGIFTYYLLEGLRGKADANGDGIVTLSEVYQYVEEQVVRKSRAAGGRQHPVMKGEMEGSFPLALRPQHPPVAQPNP